MFSCGGGPAVIQLDKLSRRRGRVGQEGLGSTLGRVKDILTDKRFSLTPLQGRKRGQKPTLSLLHHGKFWSKWNTAKQNVIWELMLKVNKESWK